MRLTITEVRLEESYGGTATVIEGAEWRKLFREFREAVLDLQEEDRGLDPNGKLLLGATKAWKRVYGFVPTQDEVQELQSADARKLHLFTAGIREIVRIVYGQRFSLPPEWTDALEPLALWFE